jgi:hypothetical protein
MTRRQQMNMVKTIFNPSFPGEEALEKLTVSINNIVGFAEQFKTVDDCLLYDINYGRNY